MPPAPSKMGSTPALKREQSDTLHSGEVHPGLYALRELRDLLDMHKTRDIDMFNSMWDTK